jgi:hypothetical protein
VRHPHQRGAACANADRLIETRDRLSRPGRGPADRAQSTLELSVIPVVGWILGGLADIRDTIAALIHADRVGAGLSILGVIPYVGDAVSRPAKVAKFADTYAHRLIAAARHVAKYDKIPDTVKELTDELIMPQLPMAKPDSGDFKGGREVDFAEETDDGWILHEVKSGFAFADDRDRCPARHPATGCEDDVP